MEKILILTGGSKGLGSGILKAYLAADYRVFSISRSLNTSEDATNITQIQADLSKSNQVENVLSEIFQHLKAENISRICLINNAGTLGNITRIENYSAKDIEDTIYLNTIAPLILTSIFIRLTQNWQAEKRILNISSGAAANPYYGWTNYCASKAALDMLTRTVAVEQKTVENGVKIIAIYPGIIDTEMQAQIRNTNAEDFALVEKFIDFKNTGALLDKEVAGRKIFEIDHDESIENGTILRS